VFIQIEYKFVLSAQDSVKKPLQLYQTGSLKT